MARWFGIEKDETLFLISKLLLHNSLESNWENCNVKGTINQPLWNISCLMILREFLKTRSVMGGKLLWSRGLKPNIQRNYEPKTFHLNRSIRDWSWRTLSMPNCSCRTTPSTIMIERRRAVFPKTLLTTKASLTPTHTSERCWSAIILSRWARKRCIGTCNGGLISYSLGQYSESNIKANPYQDLRQVYSLLKKCKERKKR